MIKEIKGQLTAGKGKYAIVVSRFNEFITAKLLTGAIDCLQRHGASDDQVSIVWVPGACEIVQAAKKLATSRPTKPTGRISFMMGPQALSGSARPGL